MSPATLAALSPNVVMVAAFKSRAAVTTGQVGGVFIAKIMLDSRLSVSLVRQDIHSEAQLIVQIKVTKSLQLVTASGEQLHIVGPQFNLVSSS